MEYLALTDTNGFYGLLHFLAAARRHGLRPIIGVHLQTAGKSAIVLAKTVCGYEMLAEIITRRHLQDDFSLLRDFPPAPAHLAVLSDQPEVLLGLISRAECWVEVVPGTAGRKALQTAACLALPPLATNRVHFAHADDYPLHRLLRAIACRRTLDTLPSHETACPGQWLKPPEAMVHHFPHCPEALANSYQLAASCHTAWDHFHTVFPHYQDRREDHRALLEQRCREGIRWRYGDSNTVIEARLTEELELIQHKGYVDYFLVVADIVHRRPIHCGRGSGAASLVSYLLGITHVDPIRHRLFFGRFLNPGRKDLPDIDVDFPWDERDALWEEILAHYGTERMAAVANHVGFGARAAVREVARVYGVPAAAIREVTRRMGHWTQPSRMAERIRHHPGFRGFPLDPPWPEILAWAARLESIPRHLAVHCGGAVLVPHRVSRHVPMQRAVKGVQVIQWEKDQAEMAGLVKIDLLGNRSLAVIRDTLAAIQENTGVRLDYAAFNPIDDPATVDLLRRGDTMGVFYVESPAMRQLQQKTHRGDFEHLVIHSSIIRPAANRYIREYLKRLHGTPYQPLHPSLREALAETYGILVYQEDVLQVAMTLAGFDVAEADGLRKVLSRKSPSRLADYHRRFHEGCRARGIPAAVIDAAWDMFASFAGYSFCKPHSASYALVSFKSAYLKAHHPAEFMAAVVSNGGGYYTSFAYLSEARRMGLTLLGLDINASEWRYVGRGETVRVGFQQLQGVRAETLHALLEERKRHGWFTSVDDLLRRVRLGPAEAAMLVKSGALDTLAGPLNRPQLLWEVEARLRTGPTAGGGKTGQRVLAASLARHRVTAPSIPDFTPRQKWDHEVETLGFVLSVHPLRCCAHALRHFPRPAVPARTLSRHVGRTVWVLGWPITRKEILTQAGESMEFVSFEDQTALFEAVLFPEAFRRYCQELDMDRPYGLYGRVEADFGAFNLTIQRLVPLRSAQPATGAAFARFTGSAGQCRVPRPAPAGLAETPGTDLARSPLPADGRERQGKGGKADDSFSAPDRRAERNGCLQSAAR
jgi:error-prone DNA polymerase